MARLARAALAEDLGRGDLTSRATVPASARGTAWITAKQHGVLAGLPAAKAMFLSASPRLRFTAHAREGGAVRLGQRVARITGPLRAILAGERTALNLVSRLSGIATLTRAYVRAARGVPVLDTRKTTPLLRDLEKYAVRAGGGTNHRSGLYDAVLVKDNHIAAAGGLGRAVALARRARRGPVEVEAQSLAEVREAVAARADTIMLDNLPIPTLRRAIRLIRRTSRARIELSGGVTLKTIGRLARLKPDCISIGALTHSAPALDFSLEVEPV